MKALLRPFVNVRTSHGRHHGIMPNLVWGSSSTAECDLRDTELVSPSNQGVNQATSPVLSHVVRKMEKSAP